MSVELGTVAAASPVPLFTAQVRMVENEGESSNKLRSPGRDLGTKAVCTRVR